MTAAAIAAQLVDVRNVGTHKVVKLTLHVAEEHAMQVMEAFGWPTMVAPIPVALARLEAPAPSTTGDPSSDDRAPATERGSKSPAQIAGYLCTLGSFQTFLREKFTDDWHRNGGHWIDEPEKVAKHCIYDICAVTSRTQLSKDNTEWLALQTAFKLWQAEAEVVPA